MSTSNTNAVPLMRLGGSTAVVDSTLAVLLAFAEPPIFSAESKFDTTARLLTGLLVVIVVFHRALFGVACTSLMAESHRTGHTSGSDSYMWLLVAGIAVWFVQVVTISIAIVDLVTAPMRVSLTRFVLGPTSFVGVALFFCLLGASLPRMLGTSVKLVSHH